MSRPVLFALKPLGTGNVYRNLAIAEELKRLFKALDPHFLTSRTAASLLQQSTDFPVNAELTEERASAAGYRANPRHTRELITAVRMLQPELVVVDGLWAAVPQVSRAGFPVSFLTDDMLDSPRDGFFRRLGWSVLRRSVVASSRQRFFLGEPSYLRSPELRVWARRYFRFSGPLAGLARFQSSQVATLRDDLGITTGQLITVSLGGTDASLAVLESIASALNEIEKRHDDVRILIVPGPQIEVADFPDHWLIRAQVPELYQVFAVSDVCIISAGLSLLAECSGLGVKTLALPAAGYELEHRMAKYYAERHGIRWLDSSIQNAAVIGEELEQLLKPEANEPPLFDPPSAEAQRNTAYSIAEFIAEQLGRRRPAISIEQMQKTANRSKDA